MPDGPEPLLLVFSSPLNLNTTIFQILPKKFVSVSDLHKVIFSLCDMALFL